MLKLSHHHKHIVFICSLCLFVLTIGLFFVLFLDQQMLLRPKQVVCTQEAKLCPGGSYVSRTGPHCEFSPCPKDELPAYRGISEEPFQAPAPVAPLETKTEEQVPSTSKKEGVICTQEVRLCSDGSFVARTGPKCEFAPCPDGLELDVDR